MAETTIIDISVQQTIDQVVLLKKSIADLTVEKKKLNEEVTKGNVSEEDAAKAMEVLNAATRSQSKEVTALTRVIDNSVKLRKAEQGSIEANRAELSRLTAEYIKLGKPTQEQTNRIKELSDTLKKQEGALGDTRRNVGNYSSALEGASSILEKFGINTFGLEQKLKSAREALVETRKRLIDVQGNLGGASGATEVASKGFLGMTKALFTTSGGLKIFKLALISTGIGAIVVALGLLVNAFLSTQRGIDVVNKVLEPMKLIFDRVKDVVEDLSVRVFDRLVGAVKNPVQAFKDLGNAIQENIINRIKAFAVAGEGFSQILSGDFAGGLKTLGNSFIQFNTGITGGIEKLQEFGNAASDVINAAVADGLRIAELTKQINNLEAAYASQREEQLATFQDLQDQAAQEGVTQKQKLDLLNQATEVRRKIEEDDLRLQDLRIERFKLQNKGDLDLVEVQKELNTLIGERAAIERGADADLKKITNARTALSKKEADDAKAAQAQIIKDREDVIKKQEVIRKAQLEKNLDDSKTYFDQQEIIEKENFVNGIIAEEEYQQRIKDIKISAIEDQLNILTASGEAIQEKEIELQNAMLDNEIAFLQAQKEENETATQEAIELNQKQLEDFQASQEAKLTIAESAFNALGSLVSIFGKQSEAAQKFSKLLALAQIGIDTARSISAGIAGATTSATATGPGAFVATPIFIATTIATILAAVAQASALLKKSNTPAAPKFAEGVIGLDGAGTETSDSIDAKLSKGESVLTAKATRRYAPVLAQMEMSVGNKPNYQMRDRRFAEGFIDGGFAARSFATNVNNQVTISELITASLKSMPTPEVKVTEINRVQRSSQQTVEVSSL